MSTLEDYMENKRSGLYSHDNSSKRKDQTYYNGDNYRIDKLEKRNLILSFLIVGMLAAIIYLLLSGKSLKELPHKIRNASSAVQDSYTAVENTFKYKLLEWFYDPKTGFGLDCRKLERVDKRTIIGRGCHPTVGNKIIDGKLYPGKRFRLEEPAQALSRH